METQNLSALNAQLARLGFGSKALINQHLEAMILRDTPSFELFTEAFFDCDTKLEAKLYYVRKPKSDDYELIKYDARLRYADDANADRQQTFFVEKRFGFCYKEAFNLLQGRWVFKTFFPKSGEPYEAWACLALESDKRDRAGNYCFRYVKEGKFDLKEALNKYRIKEIAFDNLRDTVLSSLQRGNLHPVAFDGPEHVGKRFIQVDPIGDGIQIFLPK